MKKLLLILLCLPLIGFGQGWERTFGDIDKTENGYAVQQTTDGGYIITGSTYSFGYWGFNEDVYLIKTDGNGQEQWSQTFGGAGDGRGNSVQQTTDGGYIIASSQNLIKTDDNGVEEWNNSFIYGYSVQQTNDGGYVICGDSLIKTDNNGVELWRKGFEGSGNSVQQTSDGGYVITGRVTSSIIGNGYSDVYLIKTDENGDSLWAKNFGGTGTDKGYSVQQTTDGGYIITGFTDSFSQFSDEDDVYLIKTDENGIEQWSQVFDDSYQDHGYSVQQTTDGGYIIAGYSFVGNTDVSLIKTDNYGIEQWNKKIGGATSMEQGHSVQQTTDGGYIITGRIIIYPTGSNPNVDIYLIKTDGNGNVTSTFNIPINPNRKLEKVVDILGKQTKPQTNTPFIEIYDDGTVEKRIVIE